MAIHHVGALIVFSTVLFEPNAISVVCLTPFLLHAAYWVHGATSDELLGVYNSLMLTCGSIGLHNNFALGSVDRPITYILPLAVLVVTWDNYFTYCYSYRGTMCYRHENFTLRRNTFMYAAVVGFCINIIVVWFVAVHISRRRWAALGIRPWFAKPQDLGEPARAAGESATSAQGTSASARLAGLFSGAANLVMSYVPSAATRRHVHSRVPVEDIEAVSGGEVEAVRMKEFDLAAMKREE
ncbi:hypothetical protein HK101_001788 [Irineochytrium annulatum]|nr:hypothetical protein HK101_001788 [Irineochytrium annulatum]